MGTPQVSIRLGVDDQTTATLSAVQSRLQAMGASGGAAGQAMQRSFGEARASAALFSGELIHIPRHLQAMLAASSAIAPVMQAAFAPLAIIGFVEIIKSAADAIAKLVYNLDEAKQAAEDMAAADADIMRMMEATNRFNKEAGEIGQSSQQKYAEAIKQTNAELEQENKRSEDLKRAVGNLQSGFWPSWRGNTAADAPRLTKEYERSVDHASELVAKAGLLEAQYHEAQVKGWDQARAAAERFSNQMWKAWEQAQKAQGSVSQMPWRIPMATDYAAPLTQGITAAQPLYSGSTAAMNLFQVQTDQSKAIGAAQVIYEQTASAAQKYGDTIDVLVELLNQDRISQQQFSTAATQAGTLMDKSNKQWADMGKNIGQITEGALLFGRSWGDALKAIGAEVAKLILQLAVVNQLEDAFGKGGTSGGVGGFFTAFFEGLSGKAGGGPVSAGMPYMVGESGRPELFIPNTSGTIVPNGIGGGAIVQNFDLRGAIVTDDVVRRAELAGAMRVTEARSIRGAVSATRERSLRGTG